MKPILVTGWNDSGAGLLLRSLDGAPGLLCLPCEAILGAPCPAGISGQVGLVSAGYRWNAFRDPSEFATHWTARTRSPRELFSESELYMWLHGRKFFELAPMRAQVRKALGDFWSKNLPSGGVESVSLTRAYLAQLGVVFGGNGPETKRLVVHCPSMALDLGHPAARVLFDFVVAVQIHPAWGFGNMTIRNGISLERYLARWWTVNSATLRLRRSGREDLLVVTTSAEVGVNRQNAASVYEFVTGRQIDPRSLAPTLLGGSGIAGTYPYGGLSRVDREAMSEAEGITRAALSVASGSVRERYRSCLDIYGELSA